MPNSTKSTFGIILQALLLYWLAWFIPREQFGLLIGIYGLSFGLYFWLIQQDLSDRTIFWSGVFFRAIVLFSLPQLSNDVFRFIWDGRLLVAGEDPFALRPSEWMAMTNPPLDINPELHQLIYADNYTVYPPLHQAIFWLSARLSSSIWGTIMILKSILVLGEIGLLWLLRKVKKNGLFPAKLFVIYAFNPLVILEIAGNGHFESLMVLFLFLGIYSLRKNNIGLGGIGFGLAIATKLLPLMLLPLVWQYLSKRDVGTIEIPTANDAHPSLRRLQFLGGTFSVNIVLWLPLWRMGSLGHLLDSVWLYFENFEFNASIFYLLKWLAPNEWRIGLITNGLTILVILFFTFRQKAQNFPQFLENMTFVWAIYLLNSAIVHPWYVIPVLILSSMANRWYGVIWSLLIYLSYSHYWNHQMHERFWVIGVEYGLLLFFYYLSQKTRAIQD